MNFSYGFNPNNEYGLEIAPSMENYNTSFIYKQENYPKKSISYNFGFMDFFALVMNNLFIDLKKLWIYFKSSLLRYS